MGRITQAIDGLRTWPTGAAWRQTFLLCMAAFPAMLLLGWAGGLVRPSVLPDAHELIGLALLLAIVPAFGEELLFRGLLIPRRSPKRRSVLLSAFLFVLWHPLQAWIIGPPWSAVFLDPWFLTIVFVLGLLLGSIYARTASLWPCVAVHWLVVLVWKAALGGPF